MSENKPAGQLKTVKVPEAFVPLFQKAQGFVKDYFKKIHLQANKGQVFIGNERYILVRAKSMSIHFSEFIANIYPDLEDEERVSATGSILYDIARAIGKADAKAFHLAMGVSDPIEKLSTGPIHFAYSGWAYVDILPESSPSPDSNYYLIYDHPYSFEADSWLEMERKTSHTTCHMNAGYSTGWCEESFSIDLSAREITCRAKGDSHCRFIMSPPDKLDDYITSYTKENPDFFSN